MRIFISAKVYIIAAIAMLLFPFKWITAWVLAALTHEMGHYIALRIFSHNFSKIKVGVFGANMDTSALKPIQAIFCYLSGPLLGAMLLFFHRLFPRFAICAFVQTCYNLLPVYPLDGGKALSVFLEAFVGDVVGKRLFSVVETSILIIGALSALYLSLYLRMGLLPLIFFILFLINNKKIKIPCKACRHRVQ